LGHEGHRVTQTHPKSLETDGNWRVAPLKNQTRDAPCPKAPLPVQIRAASLLVVLLRLSRDREHVVLHVDLDGAING
jgi:hypothetical protein